MPIPKPKKGESQGDFISRCAGDASMNEDYPTQKQRLGVCYTSWRNRKEKTEPEKEVDATKQETEGVPVETDGRITIVDNFRLPSDAELQVITVSRRLGIKALYSITRKKILEFYFDTFKEWTSEKAVEWYSAQKETKFQPEKQTKRFFKVDNEQRIVYGVVLVPWEIDLQGDIMNEEEVEKAAHKFVESFQNVDAMHEISGVGTLLESYIAPSDFYMGDGEVVKGSWVLVTRADKKVWGKIKKGELVGYSMGYVGRRKEEEV